MDLPIISDVIPQENDLEKDKKYLYCTCGKSLKGGLCDGSHGVTKLKPLTFTAQKTGRAYICMCKHTKNPPYCDASHNAFDDDAIGTTGN